MDVPKRNKPEKRLENRNQGWNWEKKTAVLANVVSKIALALDPELGRLVFYAKQQKGDGNGHCIKCKEVRQIKSNISTQEGPYPTSLKTSSRRMQAGTFGSHIKGQKAGEGKGDRIDHEHQIQGEGNIATPKHAAYPADPTGNVFRKQFARGVAEDFAFGEKFDERIDERNKNIKQGVFDVTDKKHGEAEHGFDLLETRIKPGERAGDDDGVVEMIDVVQALIKADPAVDAQNRRNRAADQGIEEHEAQESYYCSF